MNQIGDLAIQLAFVDANPDFLALAKVDAAGTGKK